MRVSQRYRPLNKQYLKHIIPLFTIDCPQFSIEFQKYKPHLKCLFYVKKSLKIIPIL